MTTITNPSTIPDEWDRNLTTRDERYAAGKALRSSVSRSSHAEWAPDAERPDPMSILEEANKTRLQHLVPIRFGRMSMSAFAFYRGTADIMAYDLSKTPVSGIQAQICGDAHISNFGVFASPERRQVFDVNDFDETLVGALGMGCQTDGGQCGLSWSTERLHCSGEQAGCAQVCTTLP